MVSKQLLVYVSERLNQIIRPNKPQATFGNISVIAVGDFHQLPPVCGESLLRFDPGALPPDIWESFQISELDEIMRQKENGLFVQMLNRIRLKTKKESMRSEDIQILKSRQHHSYPKESLHIFGKNEEVDLHNQRMLSTLPTRIVTIPAQDTVKTSEQRHYRSKNPIKFSKKDNPNLPDILTIAEGARAMLINNIDVNDGLVNGVVGTVTKISEKKNIYDLPQYIAITFDDEKVGEKAKAKQVKGNYPSNSVIVEPKHSYPVKKGTKTYTRYQYPLKLSWAVTIHKIQGMTISNNLVINMSNIFCEGMAYVALSRVRDINNLFITNLNLKSIYTSERTCHALKEMENLCLGNNVFDPKQHLKIAHHNTQSIKKHFKAFCTNISFENYDIICLTETWINDLSSTSYEIPNYEMLAINRKNGRGGGVAIYLSNQIKKKTELLEANNDTIEKICLKIICDDQEWETSLILCVIYRPPHLPKESLKSLPKLLKNTMKNQHATQIVVVGDFNEDLKASKNCTIWKYFTNERFEQQIKTFTTTSGTLLDAIYTFQIPNCHAGVLSSFYSLHEPVYLWICTKDCCKEKLTRTGK